MLRILGKPPPMTIALVVINSVIFAYGTITQTQHAIIAHYGFIPDELFRSSSASWQDSIMRLFTSMFIHANITHILFNLFALSYMGGFAERSMGIPRFTLLYLVAGLGGGLFHGVISSDVLSNGDTILIGASGAISGILGVSAALGDIRGYYWLAIQVLYVFIGSVASLSIAFLAHVGGFATGLVLTKFMIEVEKRKRNWRSNTYST